MSDNKRNTLVTNSRKKRPVKKTLQRKNSTDAIKSNKKPEIVYSKVLTKKYELSFVDDICTIGKFVVHGEIDHTKQTIKILRKTTESNINNAFIHEHIHAGLELLGLSKLNNERTVGFLSLIFTSILEENYDYKLKYLH